MLLSLVWLIAHIRVGAIIVSTATHQTRLDFSLLGETELWSRLLDLLHQLSSSAAHPQFSVENLQQISDQHPWPAPRQFVVHGHEAQPQSNASVCPSQAPSELAVSYVHQLPQTPPIKKRAQRVAKSPVQTPQPLQA